MVGGNRRSSVVRLRDVRVLRSRRHRIEHTVANIRRRTTYHHRCVGYSVVSPLSLVTGAVGVRVVRTRLINSAARVVFTAARVCLAAYGSALTFARL